MKRALTVCAISLFLLTGGSAFGQSLSKRDLARLHVRTWELSQLKLPGEEAKPVEEICRKPRSNPILDFKPDGTFHGNLCCNSMNGRYTGTLDGSFKFTEVGHTSLGCLPFEGLEDETFANHISDVTSLELDQNTLKFFTVSGAIFIYAIKSKSEDATIMN